MSPGDTVRFRPIRRSRLLVGRIREVRLEGVVICSDEPIGRFVVHRFFTVSADRLTVLKAVEG